MNLEEMTPEMRESLQTMVDQIGLDFGATVHVGSFVRNAALERWQPADEGPQSIDELLAADWLRAAEAGSYGYNPSFETVTFETSVPRDGSEGFCVCSLARNTAHSDRPPFYTKFIDYRPLGAQATPKAPAADGPARAPEQASGGIAASPTPEAATQSRAPVPGDITDFAGQVFVSDATSSMLSAYVPVGVDVADYLAREWRLAREGGSVRSAGGGFEFPIGSVSRRGIRVICTIMPNTKYTFVGAKPFFLSRFSSVHPTRLLESFANLGTTDAFLDDLARFAIPEEWDFQGGSASGHRHEILYSYITAVFYRLAQEARAGATDKICIASDGSFVAFNTGLVDRIHLNDIFACFDHVSQDHYEYVGFCVAGMGPVGKRLVKHFGKNLPRAAEFFAQKEDLLFDVAAELFTDYDHILRDNACRMPLQFLLACARSVDSTQAVEMLESAQGLDLNARADLIKSRMGAILEEDYLLEKAYVDRIVPAIERSATLARRNFRMAIPCYYPRSDSMGFLLPIDLTGDGIPDVALVTQRHADQPNVYQGHTILTMRQAYKDARLICPPNSDWLSTNTGEAAGDSERDDA